MLRVNPWDTPVACMPYVDCTPPPSPLRSVSEFRTGNLVDRTVGGGVGGTADAPFVGGGGLGGMDVRVSTNGFQGTGN